MAKKEVEKKLLDKQNWSSTFKLIGEVRINDNSFQLDQVSQKSNWQYSRANIGVFCGDECGTVYASAMGGYGIDRDNVIYVHGKDNNDKDDFNNKFQIAWEDRFDESVISEVGDLCFLQVGLEKDTKGKTVYEKFLSEYDMIQYLSEHLEDGMSVAISGNLSYQEYEGSVNVQKEITRVTLITDPNKDNYKAEFTQSLLINKDSLGDVDKEKSVVYVDGYVLEYFKEYNGWNLAHGDAKGQNVPLRKTFEYELDPEKKELQKKAIAKLFKPKRGVSQITFVGKFVESGGATIKPTIDDLPDDIKELIECGIYTEEEALAECADNGSRERRMIILKPVIKKIVKDDVTTNVPQIFEEKYSDEDLDLFFLTPKEEEFHVPEDDEELPEGFDVEEEKEEESSDDDSLSWLDDLD